VKASMFLRGAPLSAHVCERLILELSDNEPQKFRTDNIDSVMTTTKDRYGCKDAPSLSKWALLELFSLKELVGRNCNGRVYSTTVEYKQPLDEAKLEVIRTAVINVFPEPNWHAKDDLWNKVCVTKINAELRYLFNISFKKHHWLQVSTLYNNSKIN